MVREASLAHVAARVRRGLRNFGLNGTAQEWAVPLRVMASARRPSSVSSVISIVPPSGRSFRDDASTASRYGAGGKVCHRQAVAPDVTGGSPPVPCRLPASRAAEAYPSRLSQTLLTCGDESAIPESLAPASQRHVVILPLRAITLGVLSEGVRTMPELVSENHRVTPLVSSAQVSPPRHHEKTVLTKQTHLPVLLQSRFLAPHPARLSNATGRISAGSCENVYSARRWQVSR